MTGARHSRVGGNLVEVRKCRHSRVGGNLVEVPAFAGMTGNLIEVRKCRHSRVGGNLLEVPAFAGMTFLRWDDRGCWGDVSSVGGVILDGLRHS